MEQAKEVMSLDDVARFLDCPASTVAPLLHSGKIPAVKIGKSWRIHIDAVRDFLKAGSDNPEKLKRKAPRRPGASQPEAQA